MKGDAWCLFHYKAIGMKLADDHVYPISSLYCSTWIGERHPVGFAGFRCAALAQLAYLFERWDDQYRVRVRRDKLWFDLFVVGRFPAAALTTPPPELA